MGSPVAPLGLALFSQRILYTCRPAGAKDTFENTDAADEILTSPIYNVQVIPKSTINSPKTTRRCVQFSNNLPPDARIASGNRRNPFLVLYSCWG